MYSSPQAPYRMAIVLSLSLLFSAELGPASSLWGAGQQSPKMSPTLGPVNMLPYMAKGTSQQ